MPVDVMVEYGPAVAVRKADGSYDIKLIQVPDNAKFPIEVKLVATQFGRSYGTQIQTAAPVERTFYITRGNAPAELSRGEIFGKQLLADGVTGFEVTGSGTITLKQNQRGGFTAERAAEEKVGR